MRQHMTHVENLNKPTNNFINELDVRPCVACVSSSMRDFIVYLFPIDDGILLAVNQFEFSINMQRI